MRKTLGLLGGGVLGGLQPLNRDASAQDKLKGLVPAPAVALYTGLNAIALGGGALTNYEKLNLMWVAYIIVWVLLAYWLVREKNAGTLKISWLRVLIIMVSYMIWAAVIGDLATEVWEMKTLAQNFILAAWTGAVTWLWPGDPQ